MDVVDEIEEIILNDVEVRHIITIPGYTGHRVNVLIFMDKEANTYYWTTASFPSFREGEICNIQAKCNKSKNNSLSWVREIVTPHKDIGSVKSEQPDAEDVIFGLDNY